MAIQPIRLFGDPVLRRPAIEVVDFDKELRTLVKDLTDTMLDAPGVGLAAPQIGVSLRVFTYDVDDTPLWLSATASSAGPGVYSGALVRSTGPAFNSVPFNPAVVTRAPVGAATFSFSDGNHATFTYTVGSVTQSKAITREVFVSPGTLCQ